MTTLMLTSQPEHDAAERERRARALAAVRRRLFLVRTALTLVVLAMLAATPVHANAWSALEARLAFPLALALYTVGLVVLLDLVHLPFSWYGDYLLLHRYGLSTQSARGWWEDWLKTLALSALFALLVVGLLQGALLLFGGGWWIAFAAALVLGVALLAFVLPVLLLPLFYRLRPLERPEVETRISELLRRAGTRAAIRAIDLSSRTVAANAAVIGLGSTRKVVLGDTLLDSFALDEIEAVVAHELGHHVHRDLWRSLALEAGLIVAGVWLIHALLEPALERGLGWPGYLPLLMLVANLVILVLQPIGNAASRAMERAADRYALELSGRPRAYAAALRRLADQNLAELQPPRWAVWLLHSHPPLAERIARAEAWAGRGESAGG